MLRQLCRTEIAANSMGQSSVYQPIVHDAERHLHGSGAGARFAEGLVEMLQSVHQPRLCDFPQFCVRQSVLPIAINSDCDVARLAFRLYAEMVINNVPDQIVGYALACPSERDCHTPNYHS
jgi:hypothetical protein